MASEDGSINIKTKIDTDDAQEQVQGLTGKLKDLTGAGIPKGIGAIGTTIAAVTVAAKAANKVIKETTEAYKKQATAEKQLDAVAKNNPYLDRQSVKALENYASQLQSISTVGDESIIPLMARLAAAGRTQAEIQDILSAAVDINAAGVMGLDQAVTTLNATYSGNIGLLGRQYSDLKALTAEELASGKAVEVMAAKFKGTAQEISATTGSSEQLKNAWGDLKEELGANFEKSLTPVRRYFTQLISDIASAKKQLREEKENAANYDEGTKTTDTINAKISQTEKELEIDKKTLAYDENLNAAQKKRAGINDTLLQQLRENISAKETLIEQYKQELTSAQAAEKAAKDKAAADKAAANAAAERAEKEKNAMNTRDALRNEYDETIRQAQTEIDQRRILGENISEQEEAQTMLNTAQEAYVKMMSDPAFIGNSGNYEHEVEARKQMAKWADAAGTGLEKEAAALEHSDDVLEQINEFLGDNGDGSLVNAIDSTIYALQEEMQQLGENSDAWNDYTDRILELQALRGDVVTKQQEKDAQTTKENLEKITNEVSSYITQFTSIISSISDTVTQAAEAQQSAELADLGDQYTDGLISYEEYCDKKAEINKKAAEEQYKIQLWSWTASILQATANVAQGVSKAIADGGTAGIITGALVSASGAAQIAAIMASKPQKPAFKTGGVIGGVHGASLGNDNTEIIARSGEMVLNAAQQLQLWKTANGAGSTGGLNVNITNNRGNDTQVQAQLTARGLQITVDKLVTNSMSAGRYNNALAAAENKETGVNYL